MHWQIYGVNAVILGVTGEALSKKQNMHYNSDYLITKLPLHNFLLHEYWHIWFRLWPPALHFGGGGCLLGLYR